MQAASKIQSAPTYEHLIDLSLHRGDDKETLEAMIRRVVREEVAASRDRPQMSLHPKLAEAIEQSRFTEDDLLTATFSLLVGLAEHITGKKVSVSLRNKHGRCIPIGADPERVRFL